MLAKILSHRFGFRCTVLFAINKETGEVDPNTTDNIPGLQALDTADLMFVITRFRDLPDEQMKHVDAYLQTGKPVIGIRPSVVAFRNKLDSKYAKYSSNYRGEDFQQGFGQQVLGATWISHHGQHGQESTRGIPVESMKDHSILQGVDSMWGPTDVYTVQSPIPHDGEVLVMGQVLSGMTPAAPPSSKAQMPLAWIKHFPTPAGNARVFVSTMGDAQDFRDVNFRRMVINACLWAVGLEDDIPAKTNVETMAPFEPRPFGFNEFRKGLFPRDYAQPNGVGSLFRPTSNPIENAFSEKDSRPLRVNNGDRICYIGNTLADRMQHFGWLETLVQCRFPDRELVFRNLGFAADELTIRPRSMNFGDPHTHLTHSKADVVFAFFGYNESFSGEAGLETFRRDLKHFITDTLKQKYNGNTSPQLVLFSPIAHENLHDSNLPDGSENNERLAMYTAAMADIASEQGVTFVDLFTPTRDLYAKSKQPLTINGIHLNNEGHRRVAEIIDRALFGDEVTHNEVNLERVRAAVLDKNLRWFNRYRATDGYSTYGQRAYLTFVDGQSNKEVMDREMQILDALTANRDKRIWAAARGHDIPVDDSNTPEPLPVKTNIGGGSASSSSLKEGSLKYLGGEEAIRKMTVAKGMEVSLFASEEQFPELVNPVQMAVDTDGRMWVAAWHTYPHWDPNKELNDKLLILPDENGDGKADRCIVFADNLHNPTGFEFWNGGVLVAAAPDILFLQDTDGDDRADVRIHLLHGIDSADTHCNANSFVLGPDGWIYFSEGIFHYTNVETPWGKPLRTKAPMLYRWNPRTGQIAEHFYLSPNPHGIAIDRWGRLFATDATTGHGFYVGYPGKGTPHQLYPQRVRPVAGLGMISGTHFPEENRGNLLICNTIGFLGILQHKIVVNGADIRSEEIEPIVVSSDGNFRPVDAEIGADGALYFLDWHNVIIGHMQHNLRDPSRDHSHGRVYRVTATDRPTLEPVKMTGRPIDKIVALLESPEDAVRYRARIELTGRDSSEVLAAAAKWADQFDANDRDDAHHLLEALWLHEQHNAVNEALLKRVLSSPHHLARAAAVRVLGHWGEQVQDGLTLLLRAARDSEPMVRAEAVVAAAAFEGLGAAEVVFEVQSRPLDEQLTYAISQTRLVTDNYWRQALKEGKHLSPAGQAFVLRHGDGPDLLLLPRSEAVCREILGHDSISLKDRAAALRRLAELKNQPTGEILLDVILQHAKGNSAVSNNLVPLLNTLSGEELQGLKPRLAAIVTHDGNSGLRSAAIAALIEVGESADKVFEMAAVNDRGAIAYLNSVRLIPDAAKRSAMYGSISPLLFELPEHLRSKAEGKSSASARYVRVEVDRKSILTLAEVQVFSQGENVAPRGQASQSGTSHGGVAERAIDGKTDGDWQAGSCTATLDQDAPWWEVDLGANYPVDRISIWNRTDCCTERLADFTLSVLDNDRVTIFVTKNTPEPSPRLDIAVQGADGIDVVAAAMQSLKHIPNHDAEIFGDMAHLIREGTRHQTNVIDVLTGIPPQFYSKDEIQPLAERLLTYLGEIPPEQRTSAAATRAFDLATQLASALPATTAASIHQRLNALRVQVIALGTVPHRMIYDKERIAVQAGSVVEFRFSNSDHMPHNLAIVQPGALEEVGLVAEATGTAPDAAARHYIPKSDKVLLASRLLQTGERQTLSFQVPSTPGIYPYVCTYPGHWRRMYGALYVVDNLTDYEADRANYIAKHPLPMRDELLRYLERNTEWQPDDLMTFVRPLSHGRSFDVGRTAFQVANCVACHRMDKTGKEFGPDLAKLDTKKFTPEQILRSLLEPSAEINEKFHTHTFLLDSGKVVTGMIVEETSSAVSVIVDPLVKADPLTINKAEIEEQHKSAVSLMPKGLLNKLTREEILDLIAYVYSKDDKDHALFHAEHQH